MHPSMTLGANLTIEIKIRKQKCIFESFFVSKIGEYYSYKIANIPKNGVVLR